MTRFVFSATLAALLVSATMAFASTPEIKSVETYLENMKAVKARFIQTNGDGTRLTGNFMLKRPGRMRFEYDPPMTDFITADGVFIYYYDGQLREQKNTLISNSLADFFLREKVSLSGDIQVSDVRRDGNLLQVTIVETKDPAAGSMTLGFTEKPALELKKWRVVDAQGAITEIELHNTVTGIKLENDLFRYYDPGRKQPKYN